MRNYIRDLLRGVLSAVPLILIAAADSWFFSVTGAQVNGAGVAVQLGVIAVAALIMVPNAAVRLICTILLFVVAILGSMTIGLFYLPTACAGAALTVYQRKLERRSAAERGA